MKSARRHTRKLLLGAVATIALVAAACVPPPAPANSTWEFKATNVTVNDVQDEVCVLVCVNRSDEPYVINIGTRVKIGEPGSASGFVVSSRNNNPEGLGAGESSALTGAAGAPTVFPGISRLDIADLLNQDNKLEVFVIYTWVMEEDTVAVNTAANDVKDILVDALNSTLAEGSLPSDPADLLDIIFDNLGNAFTLLLSNIPLLGLGDDVGGGAINVGIAAKGGLADIIDDSIGTTPIPSFQIPIAELPPDIDYVNIFTTKGTKTFTGQSFDYTNLLGNVDGLHTYSFQANQG